MPLVCAIFCGILLALAFPLTLSPLPEMFGGGTIDLPFWNAAGGYAQAPWAAFFALVPLLEAVRRVSMPRMAFIFGYIAGLVWLMLHWMWLSSFGWVPVVLLSAFFALPMGLFAVAMHFLMHSDRSRNSAGAMLWGGAMLWTGIEYLRSFGLWAFPWNLLGYSQAGNAGFIQSADIGGVYLVSFFIALANLAIFALLCGQWPMRARLGHAFVAGALLLANFAYGEARMNIYPPASEGSFDIALVQGGLDTLERWSPEMLQKSIDAYVPLSEKAVSDWMAELPQQDRDSDEVYGPEVPWEEPNLIVLWPETSLPTPGGIDPRHPERMPGQVRDLVRDGRGHVALVSGSMGRPQDNSTYENGVLITEHEFEMDWAYSKLRLVPYGEVVPFRNVVSFLPFPWGKRDVTVGNSLKPYSLMGKRFGLGVCFDNVFSFVFRGQAKQGAEALLLVTNNSWYKLNSGIRQHCDIDILRAVENRRSVARVSTTGWSHLVDAQGKVQQSTGIDSAGVITGSMGRHVGNTPYMQFGDLFAQLCLLFSLFIALPAFFTGKNEGML